MAAGDPFDLTTLVQQKIDILGPTEASKFFSVSVPTILKWRDGGTLPNMVAGQKVLDELVESNPPEQWGEKGKKVQLLLPIYEAFTPYTFFTLFRCIRRYGAEQIGVIPKTRTLIVEARNDLAAKFLATDSEWCIYIDSDMILPCGSGAMLRGIGLSFPEPKASRNAIDRIMSHPADKLIVGGLYRDRRGKNKVQCASAFGASPTRNAELLNLLKNPGADELQKEGWVGFGMVRIHRSVFERMMTEAPKHFPEIMPARPGDAWGFFDTSRARRGEDVSACRRAEAIGIDTWLDTGLLLGHEGRIIN